MSIEEIDMNIEIWKDIPGWEHCYRISNWGNLYSYHHKKLLKVRPNNYGYYNQTLYDGKTHRQKPMMLHRLVMLTFVGEPPQIQPEVNHIDGNRSNNRLDNLEYCSRQENMDHAKRTGLLVSQRQAIKDRSAKPDFHLRVYGDKHPKVKWSDEIKTEIRTLHSSGTTFPQLLKIYSEIPKCTIWAFISGRRK